MNIGQKIRQMRLSRNLTQSELCGEAITRNMLSLIENGSASPSVKTLLYLAQRLDVPAGYLISDDSVDAENEYLKMHIIGNVRSALKNGDYSGCIALCESSVRDYDDEINLILSECYINLAEEAYTVGHFTSAREYISKAVKTAAETIYNTSDIRNRSSVMAVMINNAESESPPPPSLHKFREDDSALQMKGYIRAYDLIEKGKNDQAAAVMEECGVSEESGILYEHLKIKILIASGEYEKTAEALIDLLKKYSSSLNAYLQYKICDDIETCCKTTGDYKSAYEYSSKKLMLMSLSKL